MLRELLPDLMTALAMTGLAGWASAWLVWLRGYRHHWHQGIPEAVVAAFCLGLLYLLLALQTRFGLPWLELGCRGLLSLGVACYTLALVRFSHRGQPWQEALLLGLPLLLTGLLASWLLPAHPRLFPVAQGAVVALQLAWQLRILDGVRGQLPSMGWRVVHATTWLQLAVIVPLLSTGRPAGPDPGQGAGLLLVAILWLACVLVFMHLIVHSVGFLMMLRDRQALVERELVVCDSLTGLSNRSALLEGLQVLMARSRQGRSPLAVLMVDIDHFKQLNDRHGHLVGDQAIRQAAIVLAEHARHGDLVGRYGGEEFVLILPDTPLGQASAIAQRLCRAIREQPLLIPGLPPLALTVSIGVHAGVPDGDTGWQQMLQAADAAMYRAKADGRDRVALGQPSPVLAAGDG